MLYYQVLDYHVLDMRTEHEHVTLPAIGIPRIEYHGIYEQLSPTAVHPRRTRVQELANITRRPVNPR